MLSQLSAKTSCPSEVLATADKAYPGVKISSCKLEKEDGKMQYEIRFNTKRLNKTELDISPEGTLIQTEVQIGVRMVPKVVLKGFSEKYPTMKVNRALKQTKEQGGVQYELAFKDKITKHEATFNEDGTFVDEE